MATTKASFHWDDPLLLDQQLSDDERAVRDAAQTYCQERLQTRVLMAARHESFDRDIMTEMGSLGLLGSTIDGYGCAGLNRAQLYGGGRLASAAAIALVFQLPARQESICNLDFRGGREGGGRPKADRLLRRQ